MLRRASGMVVLMMAVCALLFLAPVIAAAQEKAAAEKAAPAKPNLDRISGTVSMIDKEHSTLDVRRGTLTRKVEFTPTTKFTTMNKPGASFGDIKEGTRVICVGKFDQKSAKLVAARIDLR